MKTHRVLAATTVTTTVEGEAVVLELQPGDHDLSPEVAALLEARELAIPLPVDDGRDPVTPPAEEPPVDAPAKRRGGTPKKTDPEA